MTYQHIRHSTTARQYSTRKAFRHNIYQYGHLDTNIRKAEGRCKSKNKVFQIWLCRGASYTENTILYAYPFKIHFRDKRHANAPQKTFAHRRARSTLPTARRHKGTIPQKRLFGRRHADPQFFAPIILYNSFFSLHLHHSFREIGLEGWVSG